VTQPGWRRWQLLVVTALAHATACTSPRGLEPSPSLTENPASEFLSGTCPVTRPVPPDQVPETVKRVIRAGSSDPTKVRFNDWYGNDVLWVALPPGAKIFKPPGEELSEKFPWVRLIHGNLTIEGRRLDDASGPARLSVPSGYGAGSGFQASGIAFFHGRLLGGHRQDRPPRALLRRGGSPGIGMNACPIQREPAQIDMDRACT
jgi:hypothetical protein